MMFYIFRKKKLEKQLNVRYSAVSSTSENPPDDLDLQLQPNSNLYANEPHSDKVTITNEVTNNNFKPPTPEGKVKKQPLIPPNKKSAEKQNTPIVNNNHIQTAKPPISNRDILNEPISYQDSESEAGDLDRNDHIVYAQVEPIPGSKQTNQNNGNIYANQINRSEFPTEYASIRHT